MIGINACGLAMWLKQERFVFMQCKKMNQIIIFLVIVVLGFFSFRFFPLEKRNVLKLMYAALFVVLTAICKRLTIMVPLFGAESLKIGFEYLPLMMSGFLLGPSYGFLTGLASDLVGVIVTPTSFPFLGFTLGTILVAFIPGLVRKLFQKMNPKLVRMLSLVYLIILGIGAIYTVFSLKVLTISKVDYAITPTIRITLTAFIVFVILFFGGILIYINKKVKVKHENILAIWMFGVLCVETIVTMILTPTWLQMMYGIPYYLSLCVRIFKLVFVIPLEMILGYSLVNLLYNKVK